MGAVRFPRTAVRGRPHLPEEKPNDPHEVGEDDTQAINTYLKSRHMTLVTSLRVVSGSARNHVSLAGFEREIISPARVT